ncbi:hypothetical protein B9Z65_3854 [Elsinoe australis]|uniref:HTH APSES-type domain-containing protein n=1 Tax=Elsinoe australis TaxID=40998 RepID=A0A2P8A2V2_9PEZI|nr:hypothetical protein B9Z65_3854 [Elsinoe australis]
MPARAKPSSTTAFKPHPVTRSVNFPPYELADRDVSLTKEERAFLYSEWRRFQLQQYTDSDNLIGETAYMVPYNGSGQSGPTLEELTGKKRFDFFAYTFTMPKTHDQWSIMWDHETGLVRTAGIFKPLGHVKSAPKTALECSEGLLKIAANVNGGRVDIQGYWVPFEAAFELSTKFAYEIRAVLYPLFGPAILHKCLPKDHHSFQQFAISTTTVQRCRQNLLNMPRIAVSIANSPAAGHSRSFSAATSGTSQKQRPKRKARAKQPLIIDTDNETASEYPSSEADSSVYSRADSPPLSPKSLPTCRSWTPLNPHPSPSPSIASIQATRKCTTKNRVQKKAPIPRSLPKTVPATKLPERPITSASYTSATSLSTTTTSGSPSSFPASASAKDLNKVSTEPTKKRPTATPASPFILEAPVHRPTKRPKPCKDSADHSGGFNRLPPPRQPTAREWSDIKLQQFLAKQKVHFGGVGKEIGKGKDAEMDMTKPDKDKGGRMHLTDLKAAIWLVEMARGGSIAKWDDKEVLAEAVRLREVRMEWLDEIMEGGEDREGEVDAEGETE